MREVDKGEEEGVREKKQEKTRVEVQKTKMEGDEAKVKCKVDEEEDKEER